MISRSALVLACILGCCVAIPQKLSPASQPAPATPAKAPAKDAPTPAATTQNLPVNKAAASDLYSKAGKTAGLEIWRIENFTPVPVQQSEFGKFYEGDSYLILKTKNSGGKLSWDIHYWIGDKSSQDEYGSAAILAAGLDEKLGGSPVQHREVQSHESQLFQSYFTGPLRYLTGGVKSGFSHVTPNAGDGIKKLYQVKGKRDVRIRQVEPSAKAMNRGDCFILDVGDKLYVFYGVGSKRSERLKAVSAANQIRDQDHSGRATVKVLDEAAREDELEEFFKALGGGSRKTLVEGGKAEEDEEFEKNFDNQVALYKVSDASGALKIEKVGQKPLSKASLKTEDCFILDTVTGGIYSWIGKKATKKEKDEAFKKAEEFLKTKNYPSWTQITRVIEGGEPATFKQFFKEWREGGDRMGMGRK